MYSLKLVRGKDNYNNYVIALEAMVQCVGTYHTIYIGKTDENLDTPI